MLASAVDDTEFRARCRYCDVVIVSRKKDIDHSKTEKHKRNSVRTKGTKITEVFPNKADSHCAAVKRGRRCLSPSTGKSHRLTIWDR